MKTCYVCASPAEDISAVRTALAARGIEALVGSEHVGLTGTVSDQLLDLLGKADFVVAILDPVHAGGVLYELGFAQALRKRTLILAKQGVQDIPRDLAGSAYMHWDPNNRAVVEFLLDQIEAAPPSRRRPSRQRPSSKTLRGEAAAKLRTRLAEIDVATAETLTDILGGALHAAGVQVVTKSPKRNHGADLAVWVDELDSIHANPLLVEVKPYLDMRQVGREASAMRSRLAQASVPVGLIIYFGTNRPGPWRPLASGGQVLFVQIGDLLDRMEERPFGRIILDLRSEVLQDTSLGANFPE